MRDRALGGAIMVVSALAAIALFSGGTVVSAQPTTEPNPGQLAIVGKDGKAGALCPLERTTVHADIAGFGARVTVVQRFTNPSRESIEAVYAFPLPADAAVDRMRMRVGQRIIEGSIKRREEARRIYDAARAAGQTAGLLDQERPNLFTQSVANIMPGAAVEIEISYVQIVKFEEGQFEFTFPMVVGPRYLGQAPDPNKISPPITPKGTRTGANVELSVHIDAGSPIDAWQSELHQVSFHRNADGTADARLLRKDEIPNRDFILRYRPAREALEASLLTYASGEKGGFFALILMPPKQVSASQVLPKEILFVMDQSGSQSGFPIQKSKELTKKMLGKLRAGDMFNVISFAQTYRSLWPQSREVSASSLKEAAAYVEGLTATGGTRLLEAVKAALESPPTGVPRFVAFNTDGFVGNEYDVLDAIQKHRGTARMFTFGIGNSVNRFLIDAMSAEGRGASEVVTLSASADEAVERFAKRMDAPLLTDVSVRFEGVDVEDVQPKLVPDIFSETPIVVFGRYTKAGRGHLILTGMTAEGPWSKDIEIELPESSRNGSAIATLWARNKIDEISREDWLAQRAPQGTGEVRHDPKQTAERITELALEFGLMSQYTSFVAVEKRIVNVGGRQRTVQVPVEMADGVSYEGLGLAEKDARVRFQSTLGLTRSGAQSGQAGGGFGGGGFGGGTGGAAPPAGTVPGRKFEHVSYDPTDNSIVVREEAKLKPEDRAKARFERKVSKVLKGAKGTVEVQIWVAKVEPKLLEELKKLGLKVEASDVGLKVVFGTCDASALPKIADLDAVIRIEKLE